MSSKKYSKKNKPDATEANSAPERSLHKHAQKSIMAILIFALGVLSFLGIFNLSGRIGNFLSGQLTSMFGLGKLIWPFVLIVWAYFIYKGRERKINPFHYIGLFLLFVSYQTLLQFFVSNDNQRAAVVSGYGGGYLGFYLTQFFSGIFGFWGGLVILVCLLFISLVLILNTPLNKIIGRESLVGHAFKEVAHSFKLLFNGRAFEEDYEETSKTSIKIENNDQAEADEEDVEIDPAMAIARAKADSRFKEKNIKDGLESEKTAALAAAYTDWKVKRLKIDLPLELLKVKNSQALGGDIERNAIVIARTLENFGIPVEMADTSVGPTVTQYTFKPSEGIKLSRITTLSNDLSLALAAHPIRIEAPIPGKALVGVEVPNKTKAIVGLRGILEDKAFKTRSNNLMVALGKDVAGANWLYDISKMPHLLVAGATNSGKSVCLNAIIVSLLYQNNPETLRFIMVDPKRVELPAYNGIPHLLTPVITEVSKTINALKWCMNEMDRRYDMLNKSGKKNIQGYNAVSKDKLPYIVFVIDELADLMVAAAKDIEGSIIRLTQMSRAVGIHLILATQRPSVDVITGLIKANIPARIAFSVASAVDSKTILDAFGAEKLLGKGDMLFSAAELSKPKRIQGAYVDDEEIAAITNHIRKQSGTVDYLDEITERQKVKGVAGVGLDGISGDEDELLAEAKEIVVSMGRASTSLLQRRLRIGYGRAASILDAMEEAGMIGPSNGSKPREILISQQEFDRSTATAIAGASLHNKATATKPSSYLDDVNEDDVEGDDGTFEFEKDDSEKNEALDEKGEEDVKLEEQDVSSEVEAEETEAEDEVEAVSTPVDKPKTYRALSKDDDDDDGLYFSK